jgi:hypothetical protein
VILYVLYTAAARLSFLFLHFSENIWKILPGKQPAWTGLPRRAVRSDQPLLQQDLLRCGAAVNAGMPVVAVGGIRSEHAIAHIDNYLEIRNFFEAGV